MSEIISWDELINNMSGDKEIVVEMLDMYLESYEKDMEKISKAIENNELDGLAKVVHTFKGSVSNFFAHKTVKIAKSLELAIRDNDQSEINKYHEDLKLAVEELAVEMRKFKTQEAA